MLRALSIGAVLLVACAHGNVVEAPMISVDAAKTEAAPPRGPLAPAGGFALHAGSKFVGTYHCAQGQTDATFTFTDVRPDGTVLAVFEFAFDGDDDHDEATGSAKMGGHYDAGSGALTLSQGEWIDRPGDYVLVDFEGRVSPAGRWIGRVLGPSCTTFDVHLDDAEH